MGRSTGKTWEPPVKGHKRASVSFGVTVTCECGKAFGPWYGKGASASAHGEWRMHLERNT
jgi:hypothetical protein